MASASSSTSSLRFRLVPLTAEDIAQTVTIYFAAFQNAHSHGCWPRTPDVRAWWERMIADELSEPGAHWLKAVSVSTGVMAGYCKWQEPKPGVLPDTTLPTWPDDADTALCDETFGAWAVRHKDLMGERGHWYLEMVGTDPKYQGQGAGTLMMQWGLKQADQQDTEAYLEAAPDAVALYEKFGFREVDRINTFIQNDRVNGTWYQELFMLRPAKSLSGGV